MPVFRIGFSRRGGVSERNEAGGVFERIVARGASRHGVFEPNDAGGVFERIVAGRVVADGGVGV